MPAPEPRWITEADVARVGVADDPAREVRPLDGIGLDRGVALDPLLVGHGLRHAVDELPAPRQVLLRDDIVQCRDHVADASLAGRVQCLEHDQACGRRDARSAAAGIEPVAGDDPRHVRPMAVIVVRARTCVDEVHELIDALGASGRRAQIVVP